MEKIINKILAGTRISGPEALTLYEEGDLFTLGMLADHVRRQKHPEGLVTYVVDRNINYTDICVSACKFCAFFKAPEDKEGSVLSFEELGEKIVETQALGGNQILLQGGLHPDLQLDFYEDMLRFMKGYGVHIHGFSPPEICHFAEISGLSIAEVLVRLQKAGLDSIPGGGAEILSDRVRQETAPKKCNTAQWLGVMAEAHQQGMRTTATMMFGHLETIAERIDHLDHIRTLQDDTGGFTAFIPWPFQPDNTVYADMAKTTAHEYLKVLAISRIYLDNIDNIQASWVTQGPKIAEVSLSFGSNDFGSTMIEENVVAAAGISFRLSEQEICRIVKGAGLTPHRRKMDYTLV